MGSPQRASLLPSVPTTVEAGYPTSGYSFWIGMFVPAKTPAAIVNRLPQETQSILQEPEVRERLARLGAEPSNIPPALVPKFIESEKASVAELILKAAIKVQ